MSSLAAFYIILSLALPSQSLLCATCFKVSAVRSLLGHCCVAFPKGLTLPGCGAGGSCTRAWPFCRPDALSGRLGLAAVTGLYMLGRLSTFEAMSGSGVAITCP